MKMANKAIQAQLNDTVGVIRENIWSEPQPGENLQSLNGMAHSLAASSPEYRSDARIVCKKILWRSVKSRLYLVGSIIILLVVTIVVPVVVLAWQH
jgi:vesicle-associated membrane protein 4